MSSGGSESGSGDPIQFDKVEYAGAAPSFNCASCAEPVESEYYEVNGAYVCPRCREQLEATRDDPGRFLLALLYGSVAAIAGALLWWGVRTLTGYEIGLIAIVVGFMVGFAVKRGSKSRGGPRYQALAVFLTYTGVVFNYLPDLVQGIAESSAEPVAAAQSASAAAPVSSAGSLEVTASPPVESASLGDIVVALAVVVGLVYAAPFLGGFENIIGLLIIGFALFEAWRMNRRVELQVTGPFRRAVAGPKPPDGAP